MADRTIRTIYEAKVAGASAALNSLAGQADKAGRSADGLAGSLRRAGQVKVNPQIDVDIANAEKSVKSLEAEMKSFSFKTWKSPVDADIATAEKKLAQFQADLKRLESTDGYVEINADIAKAEGKLAAFKRELAMLQRQDSTPEIDARIDKAQANIGRVQSDLKALQGLKADLNVDADISKARSAITSLQGDVSRLSGQRAELFVTAKNNATSALAGARSDLKSLQGMKAEMVVSADTKSLDGLASKGAKAGSDTASSMGHAIMDGLNSIPVAGAVAGILGAAGLAGAAAFEKALRFEKSVDLFSAQSGLDAATAQKYGQAAGGAYRNAWGDSLDELVSTAKVAKDNMIIFDDMSQSQMQGGIEQLTAISQLMGVDVTEAAKAAGAMIKNGMVDNAQQAFDVMTVGVQNGVNSFGDLTDTLIEYPSMFKSLGLNGQQAMGLIGQAMDAGAYNTDKAADALKEFSIRAQDGSKSTAEGFQAIGLNANDMGAKIAKGGDAGRQGLQQVLDGLRSIEDPIARNAAGVELFGTQWEDMGNGAAILAMNLDDLGGKWVVAGDSAEKAMARMQDNAATKFAQTWRTIESTGTQVGQTLLNALSPVIDNLTNGITNNSAGVMQFFIDIGNSAFETAKGALQMGASFAEAFGQGINAAADMASAIAPVVTGLGYMTHNQDLINLGGSLSTASDSMHDLGNKTLDTANFLRNDAVAGVQSLQDNFNNFAGGAVMQAKVQDAISVMTADLDNFTATVNNAGGTVKINGEALNAEQALNNFMTTVEGSNGNVTIDGQTLPAQEAYELFKTNIANGHVDMKISADTSTADANIEAWKSGQLANGWSMKVGADTTPAVGTLGALSSQISSTSSNVNVGGNTSPAIGTLGGLSAQISGTQANVGIGGNTAPVYTALGSAVGAVNSSSGTMGVNGNNAGAIGSVNSAVGHANGSSGTIGVQGNNAGAIGSVDGAVGHANGSSGTIGVLGENSNAIGSVDGAVGHANGSSGTIGVLGENSGAIGSVDGAVQHADGSSGTVTVNADTSNAETTLMGLITRNWATTVTATVNVWENVKRTFSGGKAHGGYVDPVGLTPLPGRAGGGFVDAPRTIPGRDNVLYPLAHGGQTLMQPLAGGEFVMNPVSTAAWGPMLEWMNKGGKPSDMQTTAQHSSTTVVEKTPVFNIDGRDFYGVMQKVVKKYER